MPLALLAVAALALAACGDTSSSYTPTSSDPVEGREEVADEVIEDRLERG